eukprot:CAMPEP_0170629556 /NCGR_PEP_ID=MMETSP0224-20130122/33424_1 /TAXON_ID=285029 /ORGANISM="Togula jolla, Strain CCCM 725" /LENGTH=169 /DNA_ID=CAMNT_0010957343 /DNA_START=225 /DNA_END=735 /DNA_ORIENTATION=+
MVLSELYGEVHGESQWPSKASKALELQGQACIAQRVSCGAARRGDDGLAPSSEAWAFVDEGLPQLPVLRGNSLEALLRKQVRHKSKSLESQEGASSSPEAWPTRGPSSIAADITEAAGIRLLFDFLHLQQCIHRVATKAWHARPRDGPHRAFPLRREGIGPGFQASREP